MQCRKNLLRLGLVAAWTAVVIVGCTPDNYRDWADLQVDKLLADRKKQTIDYLPDTSLPHGAATTRPIERAYEQVPFTRVAPAQVPPIELRKVQYDFGPLGPDLELKDAPQAESERSGMELLDQRLKAEDQLGPPAPGQTILKLDLFSSLEYAVAHSRSYQDQLDTLYLSALDVTLQRHLFEPQPFASVRTAYSGSNGDTGYASALRVINTVGMKQNLPMGGQLTASAVHNFVQTLSGEAADGNSAQLVLAGSIPLLRGFGMVNLEPLIQSERSLVYQVRAFEEYRRQFVVDIASQYFNLLARQTAVTNRRLNLMNLDALTERTRALYDAGRLSFLEVQRAMQSRLSAESSLISAEEQYVAAMDDYKLVLGMPVDAPLDVAAVKLDVSVPQADENEAIRLAGLYRLDLQTARDRVDDARRGVKNAQNDLLPDLNAEGSISTGDPGNYSTIDLDSRNASYNAGVTLDLPLDRLRERNNYRRALIGVDQSNRRLVDLHDRIVSDVRAALRSIRTAEINYKIQVRGIELAEKRLVFSNELLRQGKTNARDVVESQQSLLDAQDQAAQALSTLQQRVLQYMRLTGTLRVDPDAGAIGLAMQRRQPASGPGTKSTKTPSQDR